MRHFNRKAGTQCQPATRLGWIRVLILMCVVIIFSSLLILSRHPARTPNRSLTSAPNPTSNPSEESAHRLLKQSTSIAALMPTAEEIVANKLSLFARNRRELVHAMAKRFKLTVPDDVERFFDSLESGRWKEAEALFKSMRNGDYNGAPRSPELGTYWRAIVEAYGAGLEVNSWPAQQLLDYGNAVLSALRPGMVYLGGTDPGCFIPLMLNETSEGEHHIVFTQNGLSDGRYLDYLNYLYSDQLVTLNQDDCQLALQRLNSSGDPVLAAASVQRTVFAINDELLQILMQKNPGVSFALEESTALKSTYADATPLGPLMELGVKVGENALTSQSAAESVDYWQATGQQLLADSQTSDDLEARKAYAHMALAQGNLFSDHNFNDQAQQVFAVAMSLWPDNTEILTSFAGLLGREGHIDDAIKLLDGFALAYPDKDQAVEAIRKTLSESATQQSGKSN